MLKHRASKHPMLAFLHCLLVNSLIIVPSTQLVIRDTEISKSLASVKKVGKLVVTVSVQMGV